MKPIYEYIDYRQFLNDYYNEMKRTTRFFSHRYFLNKAGITSSSFLKQVMDYKKNLSSQSISKFIKAIGLDKKESGFFRHLVLFNQAASTQEKQEHYAVLIRLMGMVKEYNLSREQHDLYHYWYMSIVRELVCLKDFKDDYKANQFSYNGHVPVMVKIVLFANWFA